MKTGIIKDNFDSEEYNKRAVNPMQSWQWGEARKKMGIEVLRIGEFNGNFSRFRHSTAPIKSSQVCGLSCEAPRFVTPAKIGANQLIDVFQITFHKIPHTSFTVGYLPRSVIPSSEVIDLIVKEAKKRKAIFVKIEPYVNSSKLKCQNSKLDFKAKMFRNSNIENLFKIKNSKLKIEKSPHPLFPDWTQVLDLTKSEEKLLKAMKSKTRYNIRLAQRHGVKVEEMTNNKGFEIFSKLYFDTCIRQKYRGHNRNYHKIIFENLKKRIAHIFVALYKNKPLAVYEVFLFKKILYYPYGGSSLDYKNVMAPNLLMWEVMRWGKKKGAEIFDMWGSLPPGFDGKNDWSGFTRFKEGYGGKYVQFVGSFDLILNRYLYNLFNFVDKIRKKII